MRKGSIFVLLVGLGLISFIKKFEIVFKKIYQIIKMISKIKETSSVSIDLNSTNLIEIKYP